MHLLELLFVLNNWLIELDVKHMQWLFSPVFLDASTWNLWVGFFGDYSKFLCRRNIEGLLKFQKIQKKNYASRVLPTFRLSVYIHFFIYILFLFCPLREWEREKPFSCMNNKYQHGSNALKATYSSQISIKVVSVVVRVMFVVLDFEYQFQKKGCQYIEDVRIDMETQSF